MTEAAIWAWNRLRPREGWLVLALLVTLVACVIGAVLEVEWVPESGVVVITAVIGLLMGILLAKRPVSPRFAWTIFTLYGLLIPIIVLANLLPSWSIFNEGWWALNDYWRQNAALFFDRAASWLLAAWSRSRSEETIVFALALGVGGWFLSVYAAWSVFRRRQPLLGLTLMGLFLALNNYFGLADMWWLAVFVGLAAMMAALIHFVDLEETWQKAGVDYSSEIRLELILFGAVTSVSLLMTAMVIPSVSISKIAEAFLRIPAVAEMEETLENVFGGVEQPRQGGLGPGGPGGSGVMPRTYLLGAPPELQETVVMTATVSLITPDGQTRSAPADLLRGGHWRALSYTVYTGRGWALSEEREALYAPGETIPLPPAAGQTELQQSVSWLQDERLIRYSLGQPLSFDQYVVVRWRGLDDLARVQGDGQHYQVTSRLTTAEPDALRETAVADIPPAILARYTQLPENLPERIPALAQEIAGDLDNPYDQARALERFLRQYPYSLDVELPPPDQDPVDFFLFDLQSGYCDYYASAMTVLARSLGLPARMALGFLSTPPDENGVQTIRQIDGHSWTEIYFDGYGWVEFEPTAGFASTHDTQRPFTAPDPENYYNPEYPDTPVPPRQPVKQRPSWGTIAGRLGLVFGLLLAVIIVWRRWQKRAAPQDGVLWAYGRLQRQAHKLGQPALASQTPAEFSAFLQDELDVFGQKPRLTNLVNQAKSGIDRLTRLFNKRRYSPPDDERDLEDKTAVAAWRRLRRPFWLLRFARQIWFRKQ